MYLAIFFLLAGTAGAAAQTAPTLPADEPAPQDILSERQWDELDRSVDRALNWLASEQQPDGSFPTRPNGQPAVTALCVLAFLSAGRLPGEGEHAAVIERGLDYILNSQQPDGLIARAPPRGSGFQSVLDSAAAAYNHAIAGLALSELYGMSPGRDEQRIRAALERALSYALGRLPFPKREAADAGGWRYLVRHQTSDSDLSVTSWYLMFLRSCRNAGMEVPTYVIDEGTAYVMRSFEPDSGFFWYALQGVERITTRGMTGAGVLSLSLAGRHQTEAALQAGDWILRHPYDGYREVQGHDRFFYGAFYCSHAMFQLGGRHWAEFYPVLLRTLVDNQRPGGGWDPEPNTDARYGPHYATALAVLALSPPYQVLPIFQR